MPEQIGLSARLKFAGEAAIAGMRKASSQFKKLSFDAKQLKAGMQDIKQGMTGMTIAGSAVGIGVGSVVKEFANFDGQMGAVKAVLGSMQKESFPALTAEAKKLGATTSFSATQAAEAMENLARAGLAPKEIISSIGPVLNAAAAEGMDLGTAADIVASNLKAFSLEASQAARVADTLAFISSKTNTDMVGLQEGLKFLAPVAAGMKIPIEDSAAALGVLADVGLKGTLAGTGLKNALLKIAKEAKNGKIKIGKFTAALKMSDDGSLNLSGSMASIVETLSRIEDPLKRTQAGMKLLGLRGVGAAAAFKALNKEKAQQLFTDLEEKARGSAKEMAKMRINTLKGQFTLLSSAVNGVAISMGAAISQNKTAMGLLDGLTSRLSQASKAFDFFASHPKALTDGFSTSIDGIDKDMMGLVKGFLLGIEDVKAAFRGIFGVIKRVGAMFGFTTEGGASGLARLTTGAAGLALAMAPIGLAIKGSTMLFGPFVKTGLGAFKMLNAGMRPLLGGLGKLGGGILDKLGAKSAMKKLPGSVGALGKALGGLDKATANPVRVVNFDEMGMGGVGGTGAANAAGSGAASGGLRAGLQGFVSRFGRTGKFLNQGISGIGKNAVGVGAKLRAFAGPAGGIAAAGLAGVAFGRWLDNKFGISDKAATGLHNLFNASQLAASGLRRKTHADGVTQSNAQKMAQQLARMSQSGVTSVQTGRGKERTMLTRSFAEARISKFLEKQGKSEQEIATVLKDLNSTLNGIRQTGDTKVVVNVDGKPIASAVGKQRVEGKERGVRRSTRRTAAIGATP